MSQLEMMLTTARVEGTAPLGGTPATPAGQGGSPSRARPAQDRVLASQAAVQPAHASSSQGVAPVASSSRGGVTGSTVNNPQIVEEDGRTYANLP